MSPGRGWWWGAPIACLVSVLTAASPARSHEHWLDVGGPLAAVGDTVSVTLSSGHYFPDAVMAIKGKVLQPVEILSPDGEVRTIEFVSQEKMRMGSVVIESEGLHVLRFTLKRPRAKEPSYEGKTFLIAGDGGDDPEAYVLGHGLEIVPSGPLSGIAVGGEFSVTVLLDGTRVSAELQVMPEEGKTSYLRAAEDEPAVVRASKIGRLLIVASFDGRGCSLILHVPDGPETER